MPGAVVSEVARRHGVAQSLLFTWRRQARTAAGRDGSILLPVDTLFRAPQITRKLRIAKLERQVYGQRSERSARLLDQLALEFEE